MSTEYKLPEGFNKDLFREYEDTPPTRKGFLKFRIAEVRTEKQVVLQKFSNKFMFALSVLRHPQQYFRARNFWGGEHPHVVKWIKEQRAQILETPQDILTVLQHAGQDQAIACIKAFNGMIVPRLNDLNFMEYLQAAIELKIRAQLMRESLKQETSSSTAAGGKPTSPSPDLLLVEQFEIRAGTLKGALQDSLIGSWKQVGQVHDDKFRTIESAARQITTNEDILSQLPPKNWEAMTSVVSAFNNVAKADPNAPTTVSLALLILCQMRHLQLDQLQILDSTTEGSSDMVQFFAYLKDII